MIAFARRTDHADASRRRPRRSRALRHASRRDQFRQSRSSRRRTRRPASPAASRSSSRASSRVASACRSSSSRTMPPARSSRVSSPARGTSASSRSIPCARQRSPSPRPYVVIEGVYLVARGLVDARQRRSRSRGHRASASAPAAPTTSSCRANVKHATIVRAATAKDVVPMFVAQKLDVVAGVKPSSKPTRRASAACGCSRAASWRSTRRWERRADATPARATCPTSSRR